MVIISADASATHQSVITVMEAARRAGLTQITFATQSSAQAGQALMARSLRRLLQRPGCAAARCRLAAVAAVAGCTRVAGGGCGAQLYRIGVLPRNARCRCRWWWSATWWPAAPARRRW